MCPARSDPDSGRGQCSIGCADRSAPPKPWPVVGFSGHLSTLGTLLRRRLRPTPPPPSRPWSATVDDPAVGPVRITGLASESAGADELLIIVHGLGGSARSDYAVRAARVAVAAGVSCLRLNQRGADRRGEDLPHAAFTDDLHHVLASPELAGYRRVYLAGYSLGGHLVLQLAVENLDPRLAGVAAICAPLDLDAGARLLDSAVGWPYRRYVLRSLFEIYDAYAERHPGALAAAEVRRSRTIREFDAKVVAPRHGFVDAADYYRRASVGPRLSDLGVPALFVATTGDPMVPAASLPRFLAESSPLLDTQWLASGGHVAFPADLDLGRPVRPGLEAQVLDWLRSRPG